ncbi:MAG: PSD1 domain-containing protein [Planctomycetales bacterium]|nr:PSD1 domain-containing protein [Planctomycetales bacterium]
MCWWFAGGISIGSAEEAAAGKEFFEKRIRPVLVRHCYECHSAAAKKPKGGLRLDSRAAVRTGGDSGPAVVPGKPDESLLIDALRHDALVMPPPPGKKLPDAVIADFVRWIEMNAPDPREEADNPKAAAAQVWEDQYAERLDWWSLRPVVKPLVPEIADTAGSHQAVDRFILARLAANGLHPAPRAERATLIRRLSFALTGLPPTPDEVEQFVGDVAPDAWERLVDRLLSSPHFGERWARHWMDVVRYTDTYGYEWDMPAKGAWRYRDYLVRAFNGDVPIDTLIREQIAGDLLKQPRIDPVEQINESLTSVMFFQMGEKRHGDSAEFNGIHQEMLDNKIDAFSKAFQATTVACARCHDHKLDAIAQREYYALAGVFMSSRWVTNTLDRPERNATVRGELKEIKRRLRSALATHWRTELDRLPDELAARQAEKEPPLEDPLHPWFQLAKAVKDGANVSERWQSLAMQYAGQQRTRTEQNAREFVVAADFRKGIPDGWSVDGVGLAETVLCGDFTVALDGPAAVGRLLPGGLFTHALSPRLNGAVRSPWLNQFSKNHLSFEYCGGDFAAHRTVYDNAFLTEKQQYLNQPALGWLRLSTVPAMKDRRIYIELATKTSNPNFPPRVGLGGPCSEEQTRDPKSWFGVTRVLLHDKPADPADDLARFSRLFEGTSPADLPEAAGRYAAWMRRALEAWSDDKATEDDVWLVNWLLDRGLLTNKHAVEGRPEIAALVGRYRELEQQLALPATVNGMADINSGFDYALNVRGDYDQLGESVPRGYLRMLTGSQMGFGATGSGRLELADIIASPRNPLTARVFVNRVWHWLFGVGIVATTDDFGHVGDQPSHPELLDHLATRFVEEGWSLRKLVRSIVLTETWCQSGQAAAEAITKDPDNRLLHHFPLRRLEAEAIRDAVLAVSGRLDTKLFGPPIDPHRQNEDPQKRLFSGPLDGDGRRSLYTKITIMEPPRFLATFNQPEPKIPTGKRDVSTTPTQSLALLNDPFVSGQAEHWAKRLVALPQATVAQRLELMFATALGRTPSPEELERWSAAVVDLASQHGVSGVDVLQNVPVWKDVAHSLFNTKEFIYIR